MKTSGLKKKIEEKGVRIVGAIFLFMIMGCGANLSTGNESNVHKSQDLIDSRQFEIENDWLMPLGGNRVNLIGNPNFIRVKGDSVDIYLPYFGVRQSGGGYGTQGAIEYKGIAEDLRITHNEKNNSYMLKFDGDHESEYLSFIVTIFSNGDTNTSVNSSQRNSISYTGEVNPLEEDQF